MPDNTAVQTMTIGDRRTSEARTVTSPAVSEEQEIFDSACRGDGAAFECIYKRFAPMVHGILLTRVSYDEVSDLVQEVFLLAFRKIDSVRNAASLGGWLATIARNRAAEHYRSTKRADELPDEVNAPKDKSAEALEALMVLRDLPEAYRETLILRLVEGLSGQEIAERTGLRPESVRVNLHRGMEMLRKRLGIRGTGK
jgi:RNA polymerase sigma-70 factor (ECF subfamily)